MLPRDAKPSSTLPSVQSTLRCPRLVVFAEPTNRQEVHHQEPSRREPSRQEHSRQEHSRRDHSRQEHSGPPEHSRQAEIGQENNHLDLPSMTLKCQTTKTGQLDTALNMAQVLALQLKCQTVVTKISSTMMNM